METTTIRDYTGVTTEQVIIEQLTENTGRGLCDSGDHYGRHWQRNQGRDFDKEPSSSVRWDTWRKEGEQAGTLEMSATVSLYHWMRLCLEFDPEMQAELDEFAARDDNNDLDWLTLQEEFANYLHELGDHEAPPTVDNTCNYEQCDLSQVLQYTSIYAHDRHEPSRLIVSVHGGCDVRGGYSSPRCYTLRQEMSEALDTMSVSTIYANGAEDSHWWDLRGGWSVSECSEGAPVKDIFDLPAYKLDWLEAEEDPTLVEIQDAISTCEQQKKALLSALIDKGALAAHQLSLEGRIKELEEERQEWVIDVLSDRHEAFVYVDQNHKAWLYAAGRAPAMELTAGNAYL